MVRVVITAPADADASEILAKIAREAGYSVAVKFNSRFESLYDRLGDHPYSYPLRPKLGPHIRVGFVLPYVVIYRHVDGEDVVSVLRVIYRAVVLPANCCEPNRNLPAVVDTEREARIIHGAGNHASVLSVR